MPRTTAGTLSLRLLISGAVALSLSVGCLPTLDEDDCVSGDECESGRCFGGICVPGATPEPSPDEDGQPPGDADMGLEQVGEICNGLDDDDNGMVDDGATCPELPESESRCEDGACVYRCPNDVFDADFNPANGCQRGCGQPEVSMAFISDIEADPQQLVMTATELQTLVLYRDREANGDIGLKGFNYVHESDRRNVWGPFNANLGTLDRPAAAPYGVNQWLVTARVVEGRQIYRDASVALMLINASGAVEAHRPLVAANTGEIGWPAVATSTDQQTLAIAAPVIDSGQATTHRFTGPIDSVPDDAMLGSMGDARPVGGTGPALFATPTGFAVLGTSGGDVPAVFDQRFGADGTLGERVEARSPEQPGGRVTIAPGHGFWAVPGEGTIISGEADRSAPSRAGVRGAAFEAPDVQDAVIVRLPRGPAIVYRTTDSVRIAFYEADAWRGLTLEAVNGVTGVAAAAVEGELRLAWAAPEAGQAQQQALTFSTRTCY